MRLPAISSLTFTVSLGLIACSDTTGGGVIYGQGGTPGAVPPATAGAPASNPTSGLQSQVPVTGGAKSTGGAGAAGKAQQTSGISGAGGTSGSQTQPPTTTGGSAGRGGPTSGRAGASGSGSSGRAGAAGSGSSGRAGAAGSGSSGRSGTAGSGTAGSSSGATSGAVTITPVQNGQQGFTTRYWDCCKPSCGWKDNAARNGKSPTKSCGKDGVSSQGEDAKNACESGGSAFQCNWGAPWVVNDKLAYGYAAFNGNNCGNCYKLQFTGSGHSVANDPGAGRLKDKQMIVQVINIGGIEGNQFDLLIPGGGVGAMNACTSNGTQWGTGLQTGETYGGIFSQCGGGNMTCAADKCQALFGSTMSALLDGCKWYSNWFQAADNPNIVFEKVNCPAELTSKSGM